MDAANERLELADELCMTPQRKIRLDSVLETSEPGFLDSVDLGPSPVLVREVGEWSHP